MRGRILYPVLVFAIASVGGMCWKPPPYHSVNGTWTNASHGPGSTMTSADGESVDVDIVLSLKAPAALHHKGVPVTGTVCIKDPKYGLSGTYTIEAPDSIYEGTDYGGAHLDIKAIGSNGQTFKLDRAFMHNASPDKLGEAAAVMTVAGKTLRFKAEDFVRREGVTCP